MEDDGTAPEGEVPVLADPPADGGEAAAAPQEEPPAEQQPPPEEPSARQAVPAEASPPADMLPPEPMQKSPSPDPVQAASPDPVAAPPLQEEVFITDPRTLVEMFGRRNDLLEAYVGAKHASGGKVNHMVERSLERSLNECMEGRPDFFIEAPGQHPLVFSNRLADADMAIFSEVFSVASHFLSRLDLSYNLITDAGIETLCNGLIGRKSLSLQYLTLRGNSIGPRGCDKLCRSIRTCPALLGLDISQNPLGRVGGLMLVEFLQGCPQLLELHLADTEVDIDVLVAISAVLLAGPSQQQAAFEQQTPSHQLKVCNLENPRIQTLQEDHTVHIGRMLRVDTHISEIYLGKHRMRDDGVRQLVSFLLENKTLRVLDLRCNELGAEGAVHLGTLLRMDCQLVQLNLSGNRIGEKGNVNGARALAEALMSNRMLKHLDLNNNGLCGEALQLLGAAVDQNSTLQSLALFHSYWDLLSSFKFHQILNDRARILPLRADFVTSEVESRIDICQVQDFEPAR
jgi:Ran GTPase-activating protein (RanGAP) involved in mRNA processing and transport